MTYTATTTETFSYSHARHVAAKVATDLKRIQRFYSEPNDKWISLYEVEITEFLKAGYLGTVTYGFQRNGDWVQPTLRYTAKELAGSSANDDDPGRIRPGANVEGASFWSYLTYSRAWDLLTGQQKTQFEERLPFRRTPRPEFGIKGAWKADRTYSAGGRAVDRFSLGSYS